MTTIYVINRGEIDDCLIHGAYSTRAKAERAMSLIGAEIASYNGRNTMRIAEWQMDPGITELDAGLMLYRVSMDYHGENVFCDGPVPEFRLPDMSIETVFSYAGAPAYEAKPEVSYVSGDVWAEDEAHAKKLTNDYRLLAIADGRMKNYATPNPA